MKDYIKNGKRVGCKGLNIDNELIKRLYLEENKTMKDIGAQLNISHWTVLSRLNKMGIKKNTRHEIKNPDVFNTFTPESCYWGGFITADGSLHISQSRVDIELTHDDDKHLKSLCNTLNRDTKTWVRERSVNGNILKYSQVSLTNKTIIKDLKSNFNITSNKSKTLKPPQNIPTEYLHHFIRGYIDGDGSIGWHKHNNKPRLHICSGSKEFLEWLVDNIKSSVITGNPSVREEKNRELYTIEFIGKQVYGILNWIYTDSTPNTRLERKYKKYLSFKQNTV